MNSETIEWIDIAVILVDHFCLFVVLEKKLSKGKYDVLYCFTAIAID